MAKKLKTMKKPGSKVKLESNTLGRAMEDLTINSKKSKKSKKSAKSEEKTTKKTTKKATVKKKKSSKFDVTDMVTEFIGEAAKSGKVKVSKLDIKDSEAAAEYVVTSAISAALKELSPNALRKGLTANVSKDVASVISTELKGDLGHKIRLGVLTKMSRSVASKVDKVYKSVESEKATRDSVKEVIASLTGGETKKSKKSKKSAKSEEKTTKKTTNKKDKKKKKKSK